MRFISATPMPSRNRPPDKTSREAACLATSDALTPLGVTDLPMPATPGASGGRSASTRGAGPTSAHSVLHRVSVFPVDPLHCMALEVAGDGGANGREEGTFAKLSEKPEALELIFYRIFELREA